jgi:uncharacterized OB-fold protein
VPEHKTIRILADGVESRKRGISACKGCGRKIMWVRSVAGNNIPFDEVPEPISVSEDGRIETVSTEHVHWGTCPERNQFRRQPEQPRQEKKDNARLF